MPNGATDHERYVPRWPNLAAFLCTAFFVVVLCAPMFAGKFLVGPHSDQYVAGYAFRQFWTEYVRAHGAVPLWNPYIFGGLPYVGAMHGDLLYPFSWIRLVVPTDVAMNLAFFVHLILAGFFTYLFLRALKLPWIASVVGGVAYQLTGQVASLVHPGHDGKLYVSALLPLALLALVKGVRDGKWQAHGLLGFAVGLAILSPSFQMAYYLLLAAGLFALYLAFLDPDRPTPRLAWVRLACALGGVLLGGALAAVQIVPFLQYLPFSPRSVPGASSGWEYATSYSMPPEELINTVLPQFSGVAETYSGRSPLKLHSEYLGVGTLMLASLGLGHARRSRLRWALLAIGGVFLIVSLGGHTPLYRLFYELLPFVKKTRAPGMAFYIMAFAVAVWAALGIERVLGGAAGAKGAGGAGRLPAVTGWLVGLAAVLILALAGVFTNIARSIADPGDVSTALANRGAVVLGAVRIALFGAVLAGVLYAWRRGKLRVAPFGFLLLAVVGLDLYTVDRRFFVFSPRARTLFAPDSITQYIAGTLPPRPLRVINAGSAYPGAVLMGYDIPDALGYHGNEIRYYDDLMGGKNVWRHLPSPQLWKLLAVRFIILGDSTALPGFHRVLGPVPTTPGPSAYLYEADTTPPYARVATAAVKVEEDRLIPTLLDPRLDLDRLVLFDPSQAVNPLPLQEMPPPSPSRARVTAWEPGRMTIELGPAPPQGSYLVVSENWYPDWRATADGVPAPVLRGNQSLITVPVPTGARTVELLFSSGSYRRGRLVSLVALLLLAGAVLVPTVAARRRRG